MANLGTVVGTFGLLALLVGLIMFLPLAVLRPKRRIARWLSIGGFIAFALGLIVTPTPPPMPSTAKVSAQPTTDPAKTEVAALDTATNAKNAARTLYHDLFNTMKPCDDGGKKAGEIAGRIAKGQSSVYDGYAAATEQVNGCRSSADDYQRLTVPDAITGKVKDAADKAIGTCRDAAIAKQIAGGTMQEVFDGDMKPSKMQELKEQSETAQMGTMACVAGAMEMAGAAGLEAKDLK